MTRSPGRKIKQCCRQFDSVALMAQLGLLPAVATLNERRSMQSVAFAVPILPGRTDDDRAAMRSCIDGERQAAYESSRVRHGIRREAVWIQPTPAGDVAVVYLEADDLAAVFAGLGSSQDQFDRWFREMARDIHGINLEDGLPPPEPLIDYRPAPIGAGAGPN